MKLDDMSDRSAAKINKVIESRFGFTIDFEKLSIRKARKLNETITANLNKIRNSSQLHKAEKSPRYMEMIVIKESLTRWLKENRRSLTESDVEDAEVLLAAKDMVDSVQDMMEKVGKMQYEQLPQLTDSIRDNLGSEQADTFKMSAMASLEALIAQLESTREELGNGVKLLSGEEVAAPMDLGGGSDMGMDDAGDGFAGMDAATGDVPLGRELREALKLKKQSSMQQREIARLQNEVTNLQSRISELIDIEDKKNG
jgi:hypothetical protein